MDAQDLLRRRAERAFKSQTPSGVLSRQRRIIGPRASQMAVDAQLARDALVNGNGTTPTPRQLAALEHVIRMQRPSLNCFPDRPPQPLDEAVPLHAEWEAFRAVVMALQRSVARLERVEVPDSADPRDRTPVGSGFLVADDLLMTAGHVVDVLEFSTGRLDRGQAVAEFRAYSGARGFEIREIIAVVGVDPELDLALLRLEPHNESDAARPILVPQSMSPDIETPVCAIGYPLDGSTDGRGFVLSAFEGNLGVKRAAIGEVIATSEQSFDHDCSTLAGNSGCPVIEMASGQVCGVHVGGQALTRNRAMSGSVAQDFIQRTLRPRANSTTPIHVVETPVSSIASVEYGTGNSIETTIPIHVRIEIDAGVGRVRP